MNTTTREISLFLGINFLVSYLLEFVMIQRGWLESFGYYPLVLLMWVPGLIALGFTFFKKIDGKDLGLSFGKGRYYLFSSIAIIFITFLAYAIAVIFNVRIFQVVQGYPITTIMFQFSLLLIIDLFSAFGEELGWRGFLLSKLSKTDCKYPIFIVGVFWAIWILPLVLFSGYVPHDNKFAATATFVAFFIIFNHFLSWLRIKSESVLVPTFANALYRFLIQNFWLILLFRPPGKNIEFGELLIGHTGIIPTILILITLLLIPYFKNNIEKIKLKK